jgi:TonB family protein
MSGGFLRQCGGILFTALVVVVLARGGATNESTGDERIIVVTSSAIRQAALFHQEPEYPPTARQFRLSGEVVVELTVGVDGKVENVEVTKGRPILNEAVTRAVRKWSFSPFLVEGHPRKVKSTLSFNFQL